jgi:hypothetical protein
MKIDKKTLLKIAIPTLIVGYLIYRYYKKKVEPYYTLESGAKLKMYLEPNTNSQVVNDYDGTKMPVLNYVGLQEGNFITVVDINNDVVGWVEKDKIKPYTPNDFVYVEGGYNPCNQNCETNNGCTSGYTLKRNVVPKDVVKSDLSFNYEDIYVDNRMCKMPIYSEASTNSTKVSDLGFGQTVRVVSKLKNYEGLWFNIRTLDRDGGDVLGWVRSKDVRPSFFSINKIY